MRNKARIIYSLIALLCACLALEAVLRFVFGLGNPILIQPDSACSYILKPDQNVVRFFCHTHTNHYGMRSDEVAPTHDPGTLRLLFIGDSITYGSTRVDQRNIFSEILHRDLPAVAHHPVEVLNASASAWAPDNELSYVQSRGIFQSDIVLLVLNDGDLTQPRSSITDVGDNLPQKRPATAIGELYTRYLRPHIASVVATQDAGDAVAANGDQIARKNLADLDSFDDLVMRQNARLVLVYIPFRKDIPEAARASATALHLWSRAHRVPMIDLTSAEAPFPPGEITLDNGVHLNAEGHLVVARAIEQAWPKLVAATP